MSTENYHFKIGSFECIAVSDGALTYAPPAFPPPFVLLFNNAPRKHLEETLHRYNIQLEHWAEWKSPYICLLINTGDHRVLVDTGANGLDQNTGKLLQNLQSEDISPEEIEMVILTHCHPDHIGGITLADGKLAFPNARYSLWKDEWEFWTSAEAESKLDEHSRDILIGIARKNLPPIEDRLDLIESEREILPGIEAIAAPGHTPGHMALVISSKGERLFNISDLVLHPIHLEQPEWCAVFDFSPEEVTATRRRILNRISAEKALMQAFHFPFPGLGHIVEKGNGWEWKPI